MKDQSEDVWQCSVFQTNTDKQRLHVQKSHVFPELQWVELVELVGLFVLFTISLDSSELTSCNTIVRNCI